MEMLGKFYKTHQKVIKASRSTFFTRYKKYKEDRPAFQKLYLKPRGSVPFLTYPMQQELVKWIYRCNHRGSAPSGTDIREKALFLCKTDVLHWAELKKVHSTLALDKKTALSENWLKKFLRRTNTMSPPLHIGKKRC